MQAQISKLGKYTVIRFIGKIEFGTVHMIRRSNIMQLCKEALIIDMSSLEFIGSSGLADFTAWLNDFVQACDAKPKFCAVTAEFQTLMVGFSALRFVEIYANQTSIIKAQAALEAQKSAQNSAQNNSNPFDAAANRSVSAILDAPAVEFKHNNLGPQALSIEEDEASHTSTEAGTNAILS